MPFSANQRRTSPTLWRCSSGWAVLVAQPGLAPRGLARAVAQHRIERDPAIAGEPRDDAPQPAAAAARSRCRGRGRSCRPAAPRAAMRAKAARGSGVWWRTPERIDDVEAPAPERQPGEVASTKVHALDPVALAPPRRRASAPRASDRAPTTVAVGARQIEAHLAGAAADLDDARVAGDRMVEQAGEGAALGAGAQPGQAVIGRIAGEGRRIVESRGPSRCARRASSRSRGMPSGAG